MNAPGLHIGKVSPHCEVTILGVAVPGSWFFKAQVIVESLLVVALFLLLWIKIILLFA